MRALVIGCGYLGLPLAQTLARQGLEVFGMRRHWADPTAVEATGVKPLTADLTQTADLQRLPGPFDWVVNCASSGGGGVDDYRRIYLEGTRRLIDWMLESTPGRFVYTSSTGVYGQTDGSEVTELSATQPGTATGDVLVDTEALLRAATRERDLPAIVLRVAGIYGPERGFWLKQFLAGEARLEGEGRRVLNLIHRDDVIGAVVAALEKGRIGATYNAVDNEPVTQGELLRWLSARTGQPLPPSIPEDPTVSRKRGLTSKRVRNDKLRAETGWTPRHPTFREGFAVELARLRPPSR